MLILNTYTILLYYGNTTRRRCLRLGYNSVQFEDDKSVGNSQQR